LNEDGSLEKLNRTKNSSADISLSYRGQMPFGRTCSSVKYTEESGGIKSKENFSVDVKSWGTIRTPVLLKDYFLKQSNAAGVLQVPLVISVWDDECGISVHAKRKPGLLV
jgi:hypothetical protein